MNQGDDKAATQINEMTKLPKAQQVHITMTVLKHTPPTWTYKYKCLSLSLSIYIRRPFEGQ